MHNLHIKCYHLIGCIPYDKPTIPPFVFLIGIQPIRVFWREFFVSSWVDMRSHESRLRDLPYQSTHPDVNWAIFTKPASQGLPTFSRGLKFPAIALQVEQGGNLVQDKHLGQ